MTLNSSTIPLKRSIRPTKGFLFIGDPHVWSKQPGRRRDEIFINTIMDKLHQAADIANEHDLWPMILGDLMHDDSDHKVSTLIKLSRALQRFDRRPACLVGNHDKDEIYLSEENALLLLGVTNQLDLIDRNEIWGIVDIVGPNGATKKVAVGGTPYGGEIPEDLGKFLNTGKKSVHSALGVDQVIWMTHEDLAFSGAYPTALPIREIKGVDLAFNGHMHGTTLPQKAGMTAWYNPGNITRMSVDMIHHVPSVWSWGPFEDQLMKTQQGLDVPLIKQHVLVYRPGVEIFSLEGRHATSILPDEMETVESLLQAERTTSAFAEKLLVDRDLSRTDDGTYTRESLEDIFSQKSISDAAKNILRRTQEKAAQKVSS